MSESELEAAIVCLIIAGLLGVVVWLVLEHAFRVAWARAAGAVVFLAALALCLL